VGCAAALGLAVHARGKPVSTLITAAALALAISFASGTRGSVVAIWIAFGAGAAVLPALRTLRAWAMLLMATVSAAGISLLLPVPDTLYGIQRIVASAGQTTLNQMSSGRLDMWRSAWRAFLHRPLFGYGEGQMAWVAPNAQDVYFQPHNIVLQLLLQWGLLGTALFGALAIPVARSCWRVAGANPAAAAPAYLVAASLLVLSLYDGAFFHVYPVMMLAFAFAMMIAAGGRSVTRAQP
jgi:O-antigen ligase